MSQIVVKDEVPCNVTPSRGTKDKPQLDDLIPEDASFCCFCECAFCRATAAVVDRDDCPMVECSRCGNTAEF